MTPHAAHRDAHCRRQHCGVMLPDSWRGDLNLPRLNEVGCDILCPYLPQLASVIRSYAWLTYESLV